MLKRRKTCYNPYITLKVVVRGRNPHQQVQGRIRSMHFFYVRTPLTWNPGSAPEVHIHLVRIYINAESEWVFKSTSPRCTWNIVESAVKHHNPNLKTTHASTYQVGLLFINMFIAYLSVSQVIAQMFVWLVRLCVHIMESSINKP